MPVIQLSAPYPTAEQVLQLARVLTLDANISITGDLLADQSPGVTISAATQAGFVVTVTTNQAHNFDIGQIVNVQNVAFAPVPNVTYNGLQTVQTIPALNQFTYTLALGGLGAGSGGSVALDPSQGFILLNSAYEYVQDKIANLGYEMPLAEAVLSNATAVPVAVQDQATRVWIGYDNYFDGLNLLTPTLNGTPILPPDLLIPLVVKNRVQGSGSNFMPMGMASDGMTLRKQTAYMLEWEWRDDKLWMNGATQALQLWLRYQAYLPRLSAPTDQMKIFHGGNAVAYTLANRFSNPRGGDAGGHYVAERDEEIKQIVMRSAHKNQRKSSRRSPYGAGHASGWNQY